MTVREEEKPWSPLSVHALAELFGNADFPWWVAGGIALELALGRALRTHSDIDVLVLRRDQEKVRALLAGWDCWAADPPGTLRPWRPDERLGAAVHDVWCRHRPSDPWHFQLMLDESRRERWISRRDRAVQADVDAIGRLSADGIPYLVPHVQLFYKAKTIRPKDQLDFEACLAGAIDLDQRWLHAAISQAYGPAHPWLVALAD